MRARGQEHGHGASVINELAGSDKWREMGIKGEIGAEAMQASVKIPPTFLGSYELVRVEKPASVRGT
jgi:hypothetical protein